jgi:uncharacterized membrane protein
MKSFFNVRHTRYTAIVMVFVWLMTLGIGIANACLVSDAKGHHSTAAQVQSLHHEDANQQPISSDKAVCLTVCDAQQSAVYKTKQVDIHLDMQTAPAAYCSALTVAVLDLNDRTVPSVVPDWREPPVSIRFLRLTI